VINKELNSLNRATVEDMKALQYNNYNLLAAENLPVLLNNLSTFSMNFKEQEIYNVLQKWDFNNNANDVGSTYFQIFYERFYTLLWDEFVEVEANNSWENFKQKKGYKAPNEYATYKLITDTSIVNPFLKNNDYPNIVTLEDIVHLAFKHTAERVENLNEDKLEWGNYKNTLIEHVAMIPAFSKNVSTGGNYKVVNATGNFHGPSWRMILDFANGEIKGLGIYPGGQSGNPGSFYYDNFVDPWATAQYKPLFNSGNKTDYQNNQYKKVTLTKKLN
jgi:penicillin amidase